MSLALALSERVAIAHGGTRLKLVQTDPTKLLGINPNPIWPGKDARIDSGLRLKDIAFCGDGKAVQSADDFVDLIGVDDAEISHCDFADRLGSMLVLSNCRKVRVEHCDFDRWGRQLPDGSYTVGCAVFCLTPSDDLEFLNNNFRNGGLGLWTPARNYLTAEPESQRCRVDDNRILNVYEAGIVGFPTATTVVKNVVNGVLRTIVSGHCVEWHGQSVELVRNWFMNADCSGQDGANCSDVHSHHNVYFNCNRLGSASCADLVIRAFGPSAGEGDIVPHDVLIEHETFLSTNGKGRHRIAFINGTGDKTRLMRNVTVRNIAWGDGYSGKKVVFMDGSGSEVPAGEVIDLATCNIEGM